MRAKSTEEKSDRILFWTTLALLTIGLLSLSSASSVLSYNRYENNYYYFLRQLMFGAVPGLIAMYILSKIDYHKWQRFAPLIMFGGIGLLILVLLPGVGFEVGGARRWINFGAFLFQPAEVLKIATVLYLASWFDKRQHNVHDLYYGYLPSLAIVGMVVGLIILQPDIGTMLVLASIAASMFFIGGIKFRYILSTAAVSLVTMWVLIKAAPYRMQRLMAFLDPAADARGFSYQINQALLAIGSGGLWGEGYGQSVQKHSYLPEPIGDSIFAIMSEELGFVRVLFILLLYAIFAVKGYQIARRAPDMFGRMIAGGITSWLLFQALINIGGITGMLPLTGIPLSFISYGSTSMAVTLAAMGIMLNISKHAKNSTT